MGLEAATFVNDFVTSNPAGTDGKSQGDDHLRLLKSVLKNTFPLAIGALKFRNDDATAGLTHILTLYRKSATPAGGDLVSALRMSGDDSTGVETVYGTMLTRIDDPVNGSEDSSVIIQNMIAGVVTNVLSLTGAANSLVGSLSISGTLTGITTLTTSSTITGGGDVVAVQDFRSSTGFVVLAAAGAGSGVALRPNGQASSAGQILLATSGNTTINGTLTVTG